jgi:hypothetical protein
MAQISVTDLQSGVYGVLVTDQTAQNLSQAPAAQPSTAALAAPAGYASWTALYQLGILK